MRKGNDIQQILKENQQLKNKISQLEKTIRNFEQEKNNLASRYAEIEEENNNLANLYVASYQLHSTLDFKEILRILLEIITNLIGAERFAIMLVDEQSQKLVPKASEGITIDMLPTTKIGEGIIGTVATTGESYFATTLSGKLVKTTGDFTAPIVCIPLKIESQVIGIIPVYSLFTHKKNFSSVDYELFNLLAGHAANAIYLSILHARYENRLKTVEDSLELFKGLPRSVSTKSSKTD